MSAAAAMMECRSCDGPVCRHAPGCLLSEVLAQSERKRLVEFFALPRWRRAWLYFTRGYRAWL